MKKLILGLCLIFLNGVSTAQESSPKLASEKITSGGHDGSGGNAFGAAKADPAWIAELIQKSKKLEPYVLRRLEFLLNLMQSDPTFGSSYKKLFAGRRTLFDALNEAQFQPIEKGPCHDIDQAGRPVERDGSAKDAPKICFSLERLSRLSQDSVEAEILALVVHELSHMVGANEIEALQLQMMVKSSIGSQPFENIPAKVDIYKQQAKDAKESAKFLLNHFSDGPGLICAALGALIPSVSQLTQANMNAIGHGPAPMDGIMYSSRRDIYLLFATTMKIGNAMSYCVPDHPAYKKIVESFGSKSQLTILEFSERAFSLNDSSGEKIPLPDLIIRRQTPGDTGPLRLELEDIVNALTKIEAEI